MTGASENGYLVRVRAQVMCRDEGTGGWMALGGGGLADVMVGRRPALPLRNGGAEKDNGDVSSPSTPTHEYFIHGKRISDNMIVLECTIKKDFQYNKVMPTFHHWVTDEKRFGLTFQTAADARAFDKGVRTAVEELLDGLGGSWSSTIPALYNLDAVTKDDDDENNIFECLNLPVESRPGGHGGAPGGAPRRRPPHGDITQTPILSAITLPNHPLADSLKQFEAQYEDRSSADDEQDRPKYVHLSAVHEYSYSQVGSGGIISSEKSSPNTKAPLMKRDSGSLKKSGYNAPPPLPEKKTPEAFQARLKCRHCHEWYLESANRAGACEYAPDCFRSCIDYTSCIKCAQCMVYHCMSDSEGDLANHPCACEPLGHDCAKRWGAVALLSLLVPCLWCYIPLRCVHRAARAVGLAGGEHAPMRH